MTGSGTVPQLFLRAPMALLTAQVSGLGQGLKRYPLKKFVGGHSIAVVKSHYEDTYPRVFVVLGLKHHLKSM